jgi:uncharacterized protein (TIGR02001 family)
MIRSDTILLGMVNMNRCIFVTGLALFFQQIDSVAEEQPAAPMTANIALVSDYVSRGLSLNWGEPALQAGVDFSDVKGGYAGVWASQISDHYYARGVAELDLYGGYRGAINNSSNYDVGLGAYFYPGANYQEAIPNGSYPAKRYDTVEATLGMTWSWLNLKCSYTLTDYFGYDGSTVPYSQWNSGVIGGVEAGQNTRGSVYWEANGTFDLGEGYSFGAHAGRQTVSHSEGLSYNDYKLGLSKLMFQSWTAMMALTTTQGAELYNQFLAVDGSGKTRDIGSQHFVVSISKNF